MTVTKMAPQPNASISPCEIVAKSLKLDYPKELNVANTTCHCGLCGLALQAGETSCTEYSPPLDFASEQIHPRRSAMVCSHCSAVLACTNVLTKYSRSVFTSQGAYRLTTAQDVLWLIKEAQGPLVAVYNTRKSAHMVWHTPVTYDRRAIAITWGKVTGVMRTNRIQAAYEALARLSAHYNSQTKANIPWPVDGLTLRDENVHMCQLLPSHDRALRASEDQDVQADLEAFDRLNQCERWALSAILLTAPSASTGWDDLSAKQPPPHT